MSRLSDLTHQIGAEAHSVAKRGRDSRTESISSPVRPALMPLGPAHCTPDHAPPARKAARAANSALSRDDGNISSCSHVSVAPRACSPDHASPVRKASHTTTSVMSPRPGFPLQLGSRLGSPITVPCRLLFDHFLRTAETDIAGVDATPAVCRAGP